VRDEIKVVFPRDDGGSILCDAPPDDGSVSFEDDRRKTGIVVVFVRLTGEVGFSRLRHDFVAALPFPSGMVVVVRGRFSDENLVSHPA
jgi:hypothetical protein